MIKLKNPANHVVIEKIDDGFIISISNDEEASQKFFRKTLNGIINLFYEFWPEKEVIIEKKVIVNEKIETVVKTKASKPKSKPDNTI